MTVELFVQSDLKFFYHSYSDNIFVVSDEIWVSSCFFMVFFHRLYALFVSAKPSITGSKHLNDKTLKYLQGPFLGYNL